MDGSSLSDPYLGVSLWRIDVVCVAAMRNLWIISSFIVL